jgi:hypothetical protein
MEPPLQGTDPNEPSRFHSTMEQGEAHWQLVPLLTKQHLLVGAEELFADRKLPRVRETWRQRAEFQGGIILIHNKNSK